MAPHAIYAREKLYAAINVLATHPGNMRERLQGAALEVVLIPRDGIPDFEGVADDLEWVEAKLTSKPSRFEGQGSIAATMHGMRSTTATSIADRILTAHAKLDAYINAAIRETVNTKQPA